MGLDPGRGDRVNLFSLVTYIPDPMGSFLDRLRQELVPSCTLKAHVTILPPRPLSDGAEKALDQIRSQVREFTPFEVQVGDVEIFGITSVIYLAVRSGFPELCGMHKELNSEALRFEESFRYHPHITLAQQLAAEQVSGVFDLARMRWAAFSHKRSFRVEKVTFVQGTITDSWIDLADCPVGR